MTSRRDKEKTKRKKDYNVIREYKNEYSCDVLVGRIIRNHIRKNYNLK